MTRLDEEATGKAIWQTSLTGCNVPRTPWAVEVKDPVVLKCLQDNQNLDQIGHTKHGQALRALETARQRLTAAKKAVDDVEEDARRAGALPGWTR